MIFYFVFVFLFCFMMMHFFAMAGHSLFNKDYELPTTVKFLRLERMNTNSFMTIELPYEMPFQVAERWAMDEYPDWETVDGSMFDPDFSCVEW